MKLRPFLIPALLSFTFLAACGDDDSSFISTPDKTESSSSSNNSSSSLTFEREQCNAGTDENCMKDERDGQTYKTVTIGTQTWMAENLNYEYKVNDSTYGNWCYNDSAKYRAKYGRLYTWAAAMDSTGTWTTNGKGCGYGKPCSPTFPVRGVCPEGWHLPNTTEWNAFFTEVGGSESAGIALKSSSGWDNKSDDSSGNGSDTHSFTALPVGNHFYGFSNEGKYANFWTSTQRNGNYADAVELYYKYDYVLLYQQFAYYGFSVRCVKD